ncbi:MAG: DUF177 domain-containing protein [Chthonomonadaceae bacterium]|nr:DUF177 domain-containing protein [Chthonomonadaceae bacterium]
MARKGLVDLNEAVQHPGRKLEFRIETSLQSEEDIDLTTPVIGILRVVSTGNLLLVEADLETEAVLECARCAAPFSTNLSFKMKEEFQVEGIPSSFSHDSYAKVVTDEPEPLFQDNSLIIDHFVRQGLLLSFPTQPICPGTSEGPCQGYVTDSGTPVSHGHSAFESLRSLIEDNL